MSLTKRSISKVVRTLLLSEWQRYIFSLILKLTIYFTSKWYREAHVIQYEEQYPAQLRCCISSAPADICGVTDVFLKFYNTQCPLNILNYYAYISYQNNYSREIIQLTMLRILCMTHNNSFSCYFYFFTINDCKLPQDINGMSPHPQ